MKGDGGFVELGPKATSKGIFSKAVKGLLGEWKSEILITSKKRTKYDRKEYQVRMYGDNLYND